MASTRIVSDAAGRAEAVGEVDGRQGGGRLWRCLLLPPLVVAQLLLLLLLLLLLVLLRCSVLLLRKREGRMLGVTGVGGAAKRCCDGRGGRLSRRALRYGVAA